MPTVNPRTNVTLSPSLDALVLRLASVQRVSKSQVLRELLEVAEPGLQRAAAFLEAAAQAHGGMLRDLADKLEGAQALAEAQLSTALAFMDESTADLVAKAEAVRGRRPAPHAQRAPLAAGPGAVAGGPKNPPASNRGVKSVGKAPRRRSGAAS
jgi:hypothetical protein